MKDTPFYAVIPAGGRGTRLWPLSRAACPKFLLPLPGPRTMIQETVDRLQPVCPADNLMVVTGARHAMTVAHQVAELSEDQIVVEPIARGSGPAIGLAVALIARHNPDAIVGSFAADHYVRDREAFNRCIRQAIDVARRDYLVTIGITPRYPETGYGYIRQGTPLASPDILQGYEVAGFKEKPDLETATHYLESGGHFWNASMFVWKASVFLDEMRTLLPETADQIDRIVADWDTPQRDRTFDEVWSEVADVTIDHGILERSGRVAMVPGDFGWSDLGDWHNVGELCEPAADQNIAINGADLISHEASHNVVYGNGRPVAFVGVDNLVVVDTGDVVLVCDRSQAQRVKAIVDRLGEDRRWLT